jgi:hypothetical protein
MANEVPHLDLNKGAKSDYDESVVAWLEERAGNLSGYRTFLSSHGRMLSNANTVANWTFATAFSNAHVGKPSGVSVCCNLLISNYS